MSLGERSIVVKGRIAHCHIGELKEGVVLYRTGVEFIENSDHVQSALVHFVEALKLIRTSRSRQPRQRSSKGRSPTRAPRVTNPREAARRRR